MLNGNNSYMHKHYIRYDENECVKCIQYYYNSLYVNKETLNHLIMQFVGLPLPVIRSRQSTRNLLDIPWIFKSWDDAFAYYRSKHFQEPNKDNPVTVFLKDAIEAYIVNKFDIKKRIYDKTNEFNLVTIEELIMTNKEQKPTGSKMLDSVKKFLADKDFTLKLKDPKDTSEVPHITIKPNKEMEGLKDDFINGKNRDVVLGLMVMKEAELKALREDLFAKRAYGNFTEYALEHYDVELLVSAFDAVFENNTWASELTDYLRIIYQNNDLYPNNDIKKIYLDIIINISKMTEEQVKTIHCDEETRNAFCQYGIELLDVGLMFISERVLAVLNIPSIEQPEITEAHQVVDGIKTDIRDVDTLADINKECIAENIDGNTILSRALLGKFIQNLFGLSVANSAQERRVVEHAVESGFIGKPAFEFFNVVASGFFTYSFKNIRHAKSNYDKLIRFARKFVKANKPKQMTTKEYMNDVEKQVRDSQPVQTDTKEEITMSAKLANVDVYQTITKAAKITEDSVRQLIAQLFYDAKGRLPTENIIYRFMQSVDVTAHEHWSGLVKFLLSEDYHPNLARLPFGEETRQSMLKVLKAHETSGTFDFSGDESLFDLVSDTKDVEKEPESTDTDNVVGIEGVGLVETKDKPSEVKDDGDSLTVVIPNTKFSNSMWNKFRINIENIFKRFEFEGNLIYALTNDVVNMLEKHTQPDGKVILPIIDDTEVSYVPDDNCVIFNDVFALQLIALLLLVEHEKFTSIESKEYMHAILKYISNVTASLKAISTDGKWFSKHHVSMHLSVFPDFAKTEGDLIRASYMIASSVVSPERANVILTMPAAPILTDLTLVPTEYMLVDTDTIKPDLVAIGIIQQMIILFTAEEKDVKIDKPETQFDIDVSKPLPAAEANFFDPKNAPNTGYAIQEDSNIKPQAQSKYFLIVNDLFTLGISKNPLAAKHDEFLGEMATFLKELNVDLEIFEPPHTGTYNAFLAVELFMLYVIEHIRTKSSHIKPTIIGSFIYYMNIFVSSNVFNSPVKIRSLINNGTFSSVKEINVNTVCTFVNRLMCTRFPFNDLLLKNKGIYLNAGQPINQAMNNLAEANQQNRPYDTLACVAYIALEVARQINVAIAAEPQPNPSTKGNTTMDNRESHLHSVENVVRDAIHAVTYMYKTPSFVNHLTGLTMNMIRNSPFATTNDSALSNALPYIIKTALVVGLVNGDLKHGPTTARTISAIYRIPTLISFTNIDNYQYLFNKIKAIANLTIEEVMNLQRNVIFRDNLEVEMLIERPAVSIVTLITLLLSQYSNTPAPQNTARFGFSSSDYAAQLQSQYNPQPINPAVNVPAGMDTGLRSFGQIPMYPAAYQQPVGTARPAQPVTFGQQAVWEQRPFDSMHGMYGNVQAQPSDNLLRDIQNLQAEIEALEQDDIILNNRLQTARTKMSRLIAKLK